MADVIIHIKDGKIDKNIINKNKIPAAELDL
jgi:hypothetical protein